jgi:L-iditol 2-dehydrogenase
VIIVCAGATGAIDQALKTVERGSTILLFAPTMEGVTMPLSVNDLFWRRDVTVTTAYGGSPADCVHALELICARRIPVADMITHHFGLADIVKGFRLVEQADTSIKIIIRPQE